MLPISWSVATMPNEVFLGIFLSIIPLISSKVLEGFDPTCQNHFTHGYGYRLFFDMPESAHLKDGSIHFNFSLSGPSNGHVLLSENPNTNFAYEIVIGAGGNTFSEIRKYVNSKLDVKSSQMTKQILSADEIRNFTISFDKPLISASSIKNNHTWTFLSWTDSNPLDVKYISFCAWTGITVNWYYDCKGLTPVPEQLSTFRKLKNKVLAGYDPYSVPLIYSLLINTSIVIHHINLDAKKALLTTHGRFNFTWKDYRIQWNPEEYDNITTITLRHHEVWLPDIALYNSLDDGTSPLSKAVVQITHSGVVNWKPNAEMVTWCSLDLKEWPFDKHLCNINIGLYSHHGTVQFALLENVLPELTLKHLEWEVLSISGESTIGINPWVTDKSEISSGVFEAFQLNIEVQRQAQMYVYSFFVPIVVTIICTLSTFWLPVICIKRLFLHTSCLILLLINMLLMDKVLPSHSSSTPHILFINCYLLLLASVHIIITCCIMSIAQVYKSSPPKFMTRIVTNPIVKGLFCIAGHYSTVEEANILPEEDIQFNSKQISHAVLFGIMVDRIIFYLSTLYMCVILVIQYC